MEEQGTSGTAGYITIEEACGLLKMKKEEVEALHAQGRLEATRHESERRYSLPSVMLQRVETLMRRSPAEGKTRAVMEELASLQFQRGHLHGAEEIGTAAIEQVKKMSEGELDRCTE